MDLNRLYSFRFREKDNTPIWREICSFFNKKLIYSSDIVCDIACGNGEFSNNITAKTKYGVDLRKSENLKEDIHFLQKNVLDLDASFFKKGVPNVFFMSNFLEHLNTKSEVHQLFCSVRKVLEESKSDRKLIIIVGPNIDFVREKYWDFFDHILPFNNNSIEEGLYSAGFEIEKSINKFLPYTTKSRIPQHWFLVRLFLNFPLAWKILGKQFLVVGKI